MASEVSSPATERWTKVRRVFEQALAIAGEERALFLREACADDSTLRREVERLLALDAGPASALEPPRPDELAIALESHGVLEKEGDRVGLYRLLRLIGSGGIGNVWLAERADRQFEKHVAIKLVKRGMETEDVLRRFVVERQILADLDHSSLTRLLDGGVTDDGRPYLVMEYVDGVAIDRWCDERRLSVTERVELFRRVCEAVDHAHRRGIVHRDVKPGNVLVDDEGRPKLLDFGIAKILEPGRSAKETDPEMRLMTPAYADPETVRGEPITPRSDVYSLGVVLYELLTGRRPYRTGTTSREKVERAICEEEPRRPSSAVMQLAKGDALIAARRGQRPARLRALLEGDLDNIVLKALSKEPARRYATAGDLAADLGRALHGLPVVARPRSWRYLTQKFVRRHRVAVAGALAVLVVLLAAVAISTSLYLNAQAGWAEESRLRVEAEDLRAAAERREYRARIMSALFALETHDVVRARRELESAPAVHRGWEWFHLTARLDSSAAELLLPADATALAAHPVEPLAAVGFESGEIGLVDLERLAIVRSWSGPKAQIFDLAFDPEGARIAGVVFRQAFVFWDARTLEPLVWWRVPERAPRSLSFDPTWTVAACGFMDGTLELRGVDDGASLCSWSLSESEVKAVALSSDAALVAGGQVDGHVSVWEASTGRQVSAAQPGEEVRCLAFSADRAELLAGLNDGEVVVLDVQTGEVLRRQALHDEAVFDLALRPDGRAWATASKDQTIRIVAAGRQGPERVLLGHRDEVLALAWDATGETLLSVDDGRSLKRWPPEADDVSHLQVAKGWFMGLACSPDGRLLATSGGWPEIAEPRLEVFDLVTRRSLWSKRAHEQALLAVAFSGDGRHLASSSRAGDWKLWEAATGRPRGSGLESLGESPAPALDLCFSPDGSRLVTGSDKGTLVLWDPWSGEMISRREQAHAPAVSSVRFSPGGDRLLTGGWDGAVRLWDATTLEPLAELGHTTEGIWQVAFDASGTRVAAASWEPSVLVGDASGARPLRRLDGHTGPVHTVAFSPDGTRLATGSEDRTIRLWDPESGEELAVLSGHSARVDDVVFTPDGELLISIDNRGSVLFWDAPGVAEVREPKSASR